MSLFENKTKSADDGCPSPALHHFRNNRDAVFFSKSMRRPDDTDFRVYIANISLLPLLLIVSQVDVQSTGYKVTNL